MLLTRSGITKQITRKILAVIVWFFLYPKKEDNIMKFIKSLNNNISLAINDEGEEVVVFGTGVGYKKKEGDEIVQSEITKVFFFRNNEELYKLISMIPSDVIELSQEIIVEGQKKLDVELAETILITLSDHLNFAIKRYKENILVKSPLHWEIKHLYAKEYEIGVNSLDIIRKRAGLFLPISEASFIALHFVNSQYESGGQNKIVKINRIISGIVDIVNDNIKSEIDKGSVDYSRFITHLRYFVMRYEGNRPYEIKDNEFLYEALKERYLSSYECTLKIKKYLFHEFKWDLNKDEIVCLIIHIERLRSIT